MTDKVQKIKEWISSKQEGLMYAQGNFEYPEHEEAYHILCNLDAFIDSLLKEPVSEKECMYSKGNYTDEDRKVLCDGCEEECKFNKKEEPVSEDLEQAIDTYLATYFGGEKEKQDWPFLKKMAIHFANWHKQKDSIPVSEDLERAADKYAFHYHEVDPYNATYNHNISAFKAGVNWHKEQLMAKAVKVKISNASIVSLPMNCTLKVGDKVLIIKED